MDDITQDQLEILKKKANIILDASQIDMFCLCPQRFFYRYVLNKGTPVKASQLDRGTLVHAGLEVYYKLLQSGENHRDSLPEAIKHIQKLSVESDSQLEPHEVGRIIDVISENTAHWEVEDIGFKIKAVEEPFLYLLFEDDEIRIYISGKIDLLVDWYTRNSQFENLPIDHKSYDRTYETRRLSNQFLNYSFATNSNYLLVNKIGFQKTLSVEEKHKRVMLSYDPLIKEEWKLNIIKIARQYINCIAEDSWPMNFTSCDKFNRKCEYFEICDSSGKEAKLYKLSANYVDIEPWDVSKALKKDENI